MKVDNAVIMAAGTSSRFAPLSYERPKALVDVKGEILIERQIRQLLDAGVPEIYVITGYKAEQFAYLESKFGVHMINNEAYLSRNNNSSIWTARNILRNSYICSADNYFAENPFEADVEAAYYAAVFVAGITSEWCLHEDERGYIDSVKIGGADSWVMLGHAFWDEPFTQAFLDILEKEYMIPGTAGKLWETIYLEHLDILKLKIRKYPGNKIFEFDTLDELREFDKSYIEDSKSRIIKKIASELGKKEKNIINIRTIKDHTEEAIGFLFDCGGQSYRYFYREGLLKREG